MNFINLRKLINNARSLTFSPPDCCINDPYERLRQIQATFAAMLRELDSLEELYADRTTTNN